MSYLEELLPVFRKGAKIRCKSWKAGEYIYIDKNGQALVDEFGDFEALYEELQNLRSLIKR